MPVTAGAIAQGAQSSVNTLSGVIQTGIGFFGGRKARKELENQQTPIYNRSKSITDYYNQALNRYQQSPYTSNLYKSRAEAIMRGTQQGLSALNDRRRAGADVANLIQVQNDSMLKAAAAAEQDQNQKFAQLGNATNAMSAEERKEFEINKMLPYQTKRELLQQKAGGYAALMNAGLQNLNNGIMSGLAQSAGTSSNPTPYGSNYGGYDDGKYLSPSTQMRTVNPLDFYNH